MKKWWKGTYDGKTSQLCGGKYEIEIEEGC